MNAVSFILLQIFLLFLGIAGRRIRTPCLEPSAFRCDNGECINKNQWCDSSTHCSDGSDERYCQMRNIHSIYSHYDSNTNCDYSIHFRCSGNSMCIPIEGRCDGYSSCADESDEANCPCEELLESEGSLEYEASIGQYRTHNKCWKLVVKEGQHVDLNMLSRLNEYRDCRFGNITLVPSVMEDSFDDWFSAYPIKKKKPESYDYLICPPTLTRKNFTFIGDVKIRYRSSWYTSGTYVPDFFTITYNKVDNECLNPEAFKCSKNSCILPEKQCDGNKDCENGLDEENCDFAAFSAAYLRSNRENATEWMRRQHNADWGWKDNTHRAVVALYLDQGLNFYYTVNEDDLIAKQLELEMSTYLLRSKVDKIQPTELSAYINALLVICHNPRNFYGFDLVLKLKEEMAKVPGYEAPLPYLTLCNAKENISEEAVNRLLQTLERSSDLGFILEVQALSIMALSCISDSAQYSHLKQNVTEFSNDLKKEQREDGSFGNEYTTALVLQALIANNQVDDKDWNSKSAVDFLTRKQNADGSFGDFLTTYLVMPTLNAKSLVDVGKVNCTEELKRPKEGNLISDIKSRLGGKVAVEYSLFIGDEKDQIHPIVLRTPENITVIELMALAADIDPKYKFKTHQIRKKTYVYEISGIPNDPESNKFWFLYRDNDNGTIPISTQSPDEVRVSENDHIIMWYKALNMM